MDALFDRLKETAIALKDSVLPHSLDRFRHAQKSNNEQNEFFHRKWNSFEDNSSNTEENDLSLFSINEDLIQFVENLCCHPRTFTEFPLNAEDQTSDFLTSWEERHALIMLSRVPQLGRFRFHLCPSKMKESSFWKIYFLIIKNKIGREKLASIEEYTRKTENRKSLETLKTIPGNEESMSSNSSRNSDRNGTIGNIEKSTEQNSIASTSLEAVLQSLCHSTPFSSPESKGDDLEQYYDELWRENHGPLNVPVDDGIDPQLDNYFVHEIKFDDET